MKVLIDADLLLEVFLNRDSVTEQAEKLWELLQTKEVEGYITEFGLDKIFSFCKELANDEIAENIVSSVQSVVSICPIDRILIQEARSFTVKDFESATELACTRTIKVDGIVTHTPKNFEGVNFPILSVEKLLNLQALEKSLKNVDTSTIPINASSNAKTLKDKWQFGHLENRTDDSQAISRQDKSIEEYEKEKISCTQSRVTRDKRRREIDLFFQELLSSNSSDGRLIYVFIRRSLMQFNLNNSYSELDIISEVYSRAVLLIEEERVAISNPKAWVRRTAYNVVLELSRRERSLQQEAVLNLQESIVNTASCFQGNELASLQQVKNPGAEIYKERLRQARYSFNLAISTTVVSVALTLVGCVLILAGKKQEGFISTVGGVVTGSYFLRLAKDANDRLDKSLNEYKEEKTKEMKIASYLSQLNS